MHRAVRAPSPTPASDYDGDKSPYKNGDVGLLNALLPKAPKPRGAPQWTVLGTLAALANAAFFAFNAFSLLAGPPQPPQLAVSVGDGGAHVARAPVAVAVANASAPHRMLVLSRYREDTTFVDLYLRDVPHVVYQGGNPAAAHPVIPDAGLEALAYLRYICDNYANLPERIAFIHAHRYSRHYDDIVPLLQYLRWDAFPFFNLNVRFMVQRFIRADIERAEAEWKAQSSGAKGASVLEDQAWQKKNHVLAQGAFIMDFWRRFITPYSGVPFPDVVSSPCCASFVVSRERILKHPLKLYQTIADWLVSMELPSHWSARVLEYTWHVLWSDGPVEKQKHICQITDGLCSVDAKGRPKAPLIVSPTAVDMPPSLESVDDAKEWKRLWKEDRHKRGWRAP